MTSSSTGVYLRQPDRLDDPLTIILCQGARQLLAQASEAETEAFLAAMKRERLANGRDRLVRHGHGPERQVQTGIGPVPVSGCGCAIAAALTAASAAASRRSFCRAGPGGPGAWMGCCRSSTCAGCRWATSARRWPRCWERTPRTWCRRWSRGCGVSGTRTTHVGSGATYRPGATSTSGPTTSTCRRAWSRRGNACWC